MTLKWEEISVPRSFLFEEIGEKALKIKEIKGIRSENGLNPRGRNPVYFIPDLFLGEMGRG